MSAPLAFLENLGGGEVVLIGIVALLLFGRKLPEVARNLGRGFSQFKQGMNEATAEVRREMSKAADEAEAMKRDLEQSVDEVAAAAPQPEAPPTAEAQPASQDDPDGKDRPDEAAVAAMPAESDLQVGPGREPAHATAETPDDSAVPAEEEASAAASSRAPDPAQA
ncbi:MAG: twin-arginine translocase TatA/TatE family subunit [Planctomycetota bacterium]|nr:twin-arginine translocase TatA/TatE family subunit [Planctomycetota bacterium]